MNQERLREIKEIHEQIVESNKIEMETGSIAAGDVVYDCLIKLFSEKHIDWLIEQTERVEVLEERLEGSHKYTDSLRIVANEYLEQNKHYRDFIDELYNAAYGLQLYPHLVDRIKKLLEEVE